MLRHGAIAAVERGWHALIFDGPGQGAALFEQGLPFRPDWEAVITPVVDFALARGGVDPARIALVGISQGGYWVPRAAAFEHRLAAAVADPGVMRVWTSWYDQLPPDATASLGSATPRGVRRRRRSRPRPRSRRCALRSAPSVASPTARTSLYDILHLVPTVRPRPASPANIRCPTLVTDPEDEAFWPGQAEELHGRAHLPEDAACASPPPRAPAATASRSPPTLFCQRVFDWLEDTLRALAAARPPAKPRRHQVLLRGILPARRRLHVRDLGEGAVAASCTSDASAPPASTLATKVPPGSSTSIAKLGRRLDQRDDPQMSRSPDAPRPAPPCRRAPRPPARRASRAPPRPAPPRRGSRAPGAPPRRSPRPAAGRCPAPGPTARPFAAPQRVRPRHRHLRPAAGRAPRSTTRAPGFRKPKRSSISISLKAARLR